MIRHCRQPRQTDFSTGIYTAFDKNRMLHIKIFEEYLQPFSTGIVSRLLIFCGRRKSLELFSKGIYLIFD